jgi:hypothetical protein
VNLTPFAPTDGLGVSAEFARTPRQLKLTFQLHDSSGQVRNSLAPAHFTRNQLQRADGLWRTTCFEAFWGEPGRKAYWELNLSPSEPRWNLYHFTDYRHPQPPTTAMDWSLEELNVTQNTLQCTLRTDLELPRLELSLCAVIQTSDAIHYFSSRHSGIKPDFHLRSNFALTQ